MFDNVKGRLGFGCMRLPLNKDGSIDYNQMNKMVDTFLEKGFNYFDTATVYHRSNSEVALRECLVKRHNREDFIVTDKMTSILFNSNEDLERVFNEQLERLGVEYIDFYLMHALNKGNYQKFIDNKVYEFGLRMKKEGKIKHFGLSFHDSAEFLDKILNDFPLVEFVQIQFNYIDYDSSVESKKCYDVCIKHHKPTIIMEPVKGGKLVNLPTKAKEILQNFNNGSIASYALRFCASFDNNFMILSGMSNIEQMLDNISIMKDVKPLEKYEFEAIDKVVNIIRNTISIPCTSCKYCIDTCPMQIKINELFELYNKAKMMENIPYWSIYDSFEVKASQCIKCKTCEDACPQHLNVTKYLEDVAKEFER